MAGHVSQHKKLLHPARAEEIRHKIRAALLIKKLEDHVLAGVELSPSQVAAALGLLRKAVPDLAASESKVNVEHSGAIEHRGLSEVSQRITDILATRTDGDSPPLLPH